MLGPFEELLLLSFVGALIGCVTGLLPSLHVNTLAVLLLAATPAIDPVLGALGLRAFDVAFGVSALIVAISVAHTYVNIVPATFLGAPDESTALSVLPGHKMLLRGVGYRCVQLSALASHWAVLASLALVLPFKWALAEPLHLFAAIRSHLFLVVLVLALLLVALEPSRVGPEAWPDAARRNLARGVALALFAASCAYGLLLDEIPYRSLVPVPPSPLLPALSGLFGAATILTSLSLPPRIPHQFLRLKQDDVRLRGAAAALGAGIAAGATMSVLPGLTNASATALATTLRKGSDEETIVSLSAVNTANAVFNLAVLYLFLRSRSGAVIAIQELVEIHPWRDVVPRDLAWFGFVVLASGTASLLLTLLVGRLAVRRIQAIPYRPLLWLVLAYMVATVVVFTGLGGFLVFLTGTALGIVPARVGVRRVALTGVLLGPVLVYLAPAGWGWG